MKRFRAVRSDLRYSSFDSFLSSAMVGIGETFLPAFVLAMGAGEVHAGLIATVPILVGSSLQLLVPRVLSKVGSYRRWVTTLCAIQSISFIPFIASGWFESELSLVWIYLAATLYWSCGIAVGPAWNSWMSSVVPERVRMRYFARRIHIGQIGLLLGLVTGGALLHFAKESGWELKAFSVLFMAAAAFRLLSVWCLGKQSERPMLVGVQRKVSIPAVMARFRVSSEGKLIGFLLIFSMSVSISSPFFNPYMLKQLNLSYFSYMVLVASSFLSKILVFALLSKVAKGMDPFQLMRWGILGSCLVPISWIVSANPGYLIFTQVFGGAVWALYELGVTIALFGTIRDDERLSVMSFFNFGSALMVMLGAAIGGQILKGVGETQSTYFLIFVLGSSARLLSLFAFKDVESSIRADRARKNSEKAAAS